MAILEFQGVRTPTVGEALNAVQVRAIVATPLLKDEELKEIRAAGGSLGGRGHKKPLLPSNEGLQGNSSDYLTARIARDRPDILDRMKAGEFKSACEWHRNRKPA